MLHFGFSYVGLIMQAFLYVPNYFWTKNKPQHYDEYVQNEKRAYVILERIGEVLVCVLSLIFSDFNLRPINIWSSWLILAVLCMICYEGYWIRYFKSDKKMSDQYASFLGVPIAGATYPVAAFFFLGIYGSNIFLILATIILGIGHIGIHLGHAREARAEAVLCNQSLEIPIIKKVLKTTLLAVVTILLSIAFLVIITIIAGRNLTFLKNAVDPTKGVEEEAYIELGGQKQYCLIRGDDVDNPVIIYIHGGPASPDTEVAYYFTTYLQDEYTVIAYNQRGSGRTYYENADIDPTNQTATFDQLQADLDELVDYARDRFHQDKVIIVGHSFGTMMGSCYAQNHPDKVASYIGVGQMGRLNSDIYAYEDALAKAIAAGDDTTAMQEAAENYQNNPSIQTMLALRSLEDPYHRAAKTHDYMLDAIFSPYTGVRDAQWLLQQMNLDEFVALNDQLFTYIQEHDVYEYERDYQMPVGFISGTDDWTTPLQMAKDYCDSVSAPCKEFVQIQGWGHTIPQETPQVFAQNIKKILQDFK